MNLACYLKTGKVSTLWSIQKGFPGGSVVKDTPANAGDMGLIPRLGRSPGGGNGSPLQYSCLENPIDRGAWPARVHGVSKIQTRLSNWACMQDQPRGLLCLPVPTTFPYPWFCHRVGSCCSSESYQGKSRPEKMTALLCGNLVGSAGCFEFWRRLLEITLCYKWSSLLNSLSVIKTKTTDIKPYYETKEVPYNVKYNF